MNVPFIFNLTDKDRNIFRNNLSGSINRAFYRPIPNSNDFHLSFVIEVNDIERTGYSLGNLLQIISDIEISIQQVRIPNLNGAFLLLGRQMVVDEFTTDELTVNIQRITDSQTPNNEVAEFFRQGDDRVHRIILATLRGIPQS